MEATVVDEKLPDVDFRILGPLEVRVDNKSVEIAARRQRALLVLLLMNVGRVVSAERLIDQLWDGAPPPQGAVTLRSYVSNLRATLSGTGGLDTVLMTRGPGYLFDVPDETVDAVRLRRLAQRGRELLREGLADEAIVVLDEAVNLWTGDPLSEVAEHESAQSTIAQLTEIYQGAVESRFEALLASGRHADALAGLEAFTTEHPLLEEPRSLLMLALYRSGRTPEALEVHRSFRAYLDQELGIVPSARMDALLQRILTQDPGLDAPPAIRPTRVQPVRSAPSDPGPEEAAAHVGHTGRILVGRERELATLEGALQKLTSTSTGSLVLMAGEPGIGKTTMMESLETMARRRGFDVHIGRAPAPGGAPAFWIWSQVVDSVAASLDDDRLRSSVNGPAQPVCQLSATVAQRAGQTPPLTGDNLHALRFQLYEAVSVYLDRASDGPLVVMVDDIHWADLPSLELLSYLTPSLSARPLLLVAAYRDLPTDRSEALDATLATVSREDVTTEIRLNGLAHGDVAVLAADMLATAAHPERHQQFADVLYERTGGNPFFVRQLARLLIDGDEPPESSSAQVPPGIRHVIASRLKPLPREATALLASAAVIGREFELRTAAAAAELDPVVALDAYDTAARHGLVEAAGDDHHRFVHALVQEVVLENLTGGTLTQLHANVAAQIERLGTGSPAALAAHMWAARAIVGTAAVASQLDAAEAAGAVYAHEQAEVHLRRALHLVRDASPPEPDTELSVLLSLFRLIVTARGWGDEDARDVADRAMQLAEAGGFSDDNARLWWSLFFFLIDRDDLEAYVDVATSLLAACDADDSGHRIGDATRAATHLMNIFAALAVDDREAADAHLSLARGHVEAASPADVAAYDENLHVMYYVIEGSWFGMHEDYDAHQSAIQTAVALADADGRPFPRAVARTLGAATGAYSPTLTYLWRLSDEALEMDHSFGYGWLETVAECVNLWSRALAGQASVDTPDSLQLRLDEMLEGGRNGTRAVMLVLMGDVHSAMGDLELARKSLRQARDQPGPYRGLFVDVVDRRLASLA